MMAKRLTVLALLAFIACAALLTAVACYNAAQALEAIPQPVTSAKVTAGDIDGALAKGPVFVEFETAECGYCKQQRPISQQLEGEYAGKVTFFFVDANENRDLARAYQVTGVPQIDVIASKSDGKYTYIDKNGAPSDSIGASRFIGLTQKDALKTALDAAIRAKG
ncbi:MAG TPA: thioredoxin family protein [Methanocella sp.]|nr:thioredoxin family protein [Methanocella sp.]